LRNAVNIFKNPLHFIIHVGKDIMINGVQIFDDIGNMITEYRDGKWE